MKNLILSLMMLFSLGASAQSYTINLPETKDTTIYVVDTVYVRDTDGNMIVNYYDSHSNLPVIIARDMAYYILWDAILGPYYRPVPRAHYHYIHRYDRPRPYHYIHRYDRPRPYRYHMAPPPPPRRQPMIRHPRPSGPAINNRRPSQPRMQQNRPALQPRTHARPQMNNRPSGPSTRISAGSRSPMNNGSSSRKPMGGRR